MRKKPVLAAGPKFRQPKSKLKLKQEHFPVTNEEKERINRAHRDYVKYSKNLWLKEIVIKEVDRLLRAHDGD